MSVRAQIAIGRLLVAGAWAQNYVRLGLTVFVIALGVALGVAVHTINHSATRELSTAVRSLAGEADISIRSSEAGFDEALYPRLAKRPEVSAASPALEISASLSGRRERLRILGIDPLRALAMQPSLLGDAGERIVDLLRDDTIMLSTSAAQQLGIAEGGTLSVQVGLRTHALRVVAILPVNDALRQPLALMDIASAQWTFARLGQLTRIDLRLRPGQDAAQVRDRIEALLPAGVHAVAPEMTAAQSLALSRAYRINLTMLALISLFTGAMLVFSTQMLAALRRRPHFALLRALGMTQAKLAAVLGLEAALLGALGSVLGSALGLGAAQIALAYAGADLGAGFFQGISAHLAIDPIGLAVIAAAGVVASTLGGFAPAREAARAAPAEALRAGSEPAEALPAARLGPGLVTLLAALGLLALPPIAGLPVFGYAAIGCLLVAAILLMPAYVRAALGLVPGAQSACVRIALEQMRASPRFAAISLATMLTSFSLAVAMLIMIYSFRHSLDTWLGTVLPADLYARAGVGASASIDVDAQERLRSVPGVRRIAFARVQTLELDPARPLVTLIARDLDPSRPEGLPLIAPQQLPRDRSIPVWISEALHSVYGFEVGQRTTLPIAGAPVDVTVAGIWRDYVRQGGAIVVNRADYVRLTADRAANDAWIWLEPGHRGAGVMSEIRRALGAGTEIELREPGVIRALSLAAFDRTFAVTYALQCAALALALFGTGVGISAQALTRRAEFGMLRHIGMTRPDLVRMLGIEGALLGALGALAGLITGVLMSLVLIEVINRQSFHWSMDIHWPVIEIVALSLALIVSCAATAAISARHAIGMDAVRAVREDW